MANNMALGNVEPRSDLTATEQVANSTRFAYAVECLGRASSHYPIVQQTEGHTDGAGKTDDRPRWIIKSPMSVRGQNQ